MCDGGDTAAMKIQPQDSRGHRNHPISQSAPTMVASTQQIHKSEYEVGINIFIYYIVIFCCELLCFQTVLIHIVGITEMMSDV